MERLELLTTRDIAELFTDEVVALGGRVSNSYDDGSRLFARSILPALGEARPNDPLNPGIALIALEGQIRVHPYVFRQVCTNGAIMAQAVETCLIAMPASPEQLAPTVESLRMAIRACASPDAFTTAVSGMRAALHHSAANMLISFMPMLERLSDQLRAQVLPVILQRLQKEGNSGYSLMNAVTSVARDTPDPQLRWRLEEFGGGIANLATRQPSPRPSRAYAQTPVEESVDDLVTA